MINARSKSSQRIKIKPSNVQSPLTSYSALAVNKSMQINHIANDSPNQSDFKRSKSVLLSPPRRYTIKDIDSLEAKKLFKRNSVRYELSSLFETSSQVSNFESSAKNFKKTNPFKRNRYHSSSVEKLASLNSIVNRCENVRQSMSKANLLTAIENANSWKNLQESINNQKELDEWNYKKPYRKLSEERMRKEAVELQKMFEVGQGRKKRKIWKLSRPALSMKVEKSLSKYRIT
ncbi:unnamed protein product [Blepharisma stoltei]|uniref:Uncharacterized protein n=1 Tax=Blepharisma stoltei TaxID=1481888 RepID=A0AAU9JFG1_9CILI|nr:unnamed protein product [Blepharisma stoltei]